MVAIFEILFFLVVLLFMLLACVLLVRPVRLRLSRIWLNKCKALVPPMSETERIALEAGDVWWEGELFNGRPDWRQLRNFPKPKLSDEERAFIDNQVETLCGMLDDWKMLHELRDLPKAVWSTIKQERFFGLVIPKKYGGLGFSALAHSTVVMKIATKSISAAVSVMVPNSLGPGELIQRYGTPEQQDYYLPRLAKGEETPCFALTSLEAGSDATAIQDSGVVCKGHYEGKEVLGIRLNWEKRYITLAPIATLLGLAFKMMDPDHLLGKDEDIGITLCLVPTHLKGVESGRRHSPMNMAFMNGPTSGRNVFVPLDLIIGGAEQRGQGWRMLMETLSVGRGISLPALGAGAGLLMYCVTGAYARLRRQFNRPIGRFEGIEAMLARIGGMAYLCEATRQLTTTGIDLGKRPSLATAITKYHLTEMGRKVVSYAMDVHAGRGIMNGPRNYLAAVYDAFPISITVEGANILTRNLIIFGQGVVRCHPTMLQLMNAINDVDVQKGLLDFDRLFYTQIGHTLGNLAHAFWYGLTGGRLIAAPATKHLTKWYRQLTRMSMALAVVSDFVLLVLGGDIKRKERLSARMGDVLSELYMASAVLRYFEIHGCPASDIPYVRWALKYCLFKIQIAFDNFFANFPRRFLARVLKTLIFPWGRVYRMPSDRLGHRIARHMMEASPLRDRITEYCYVGKGKDDPVGRIERAFQAVLAAEPARRKLRKAVRRGAVPRLGGVEEQITAALKKNLLTPEEGDLLRVAEAQTADALQVDSWQVDAWEGNT